MNNANELSMNLQARAHELVEELCTRSTEIDDTRHLPQDIAEKMAAQGFYRLITPVELGGLGASPRMMCSLVCIYRFNKPISVWCTI